MEYEFKKTKEKEDFNLHKVMKKQVFILGTSHVSEEAKNKIIFYFNSLKPQIVAVELDRERAFALENDVERKNNFFSMMKEYGFFATLFFFIGSFVQKTIGEKLDFKAGSEMLTAIKLSKENNIPIALVDKNIKDTFNSFKNIPFKEKIKLFYFAITGKFYDKNIKSLDLKKIPSDEIVEKIIKVFKKDFPVFYDVLIESRNKYMSSNVLRLLEYYNKIFLIVGKGHVEGIKKLLEEKAEESEIIILQ